MSTRASYAAAEWPVRDARAIDWGTVSEPRYLDGEPMLNSDDMGVSPRAAAPRPAPRNAPSSAGFLTLKEASLLTRTPSETIRFWIWQGRLLAFKPGRSVLVKEVELLALVASRETKKIRAAKNKRSVVKS